MRARPIRLDEQSFHRDISALKGDVFDVPFVAVGVYRPHADYRSEEAKNNECVFN
jgi:hypothetical protein